MPRQSGGGRPLLDGLIRVRGRELVIHDPHMRDAISADLINENREFGGVCAKALGCTGRIVTECNRWSP
jgi:hypothetical protein